MLKFGKINAIGEPNNPAQAGKYNVMLIEDNIITNWLYQLKRNSLKDNDDYYFDINEPVAVFMCDDNRTGVILGAINSQKTKNATVDQDVEQRKYSDGSLVSYDRKEHTLTIDLTSSNGKLIINGGKNKGLLILDAVIKKLNNIENDINTLKTTFSALGDSAASVLTATPGDPDAGFAAIVAGLSSWYGQELDITVEGDVEDKNVTH